MKDFVSAVGVSFFQGCGQDAAGNYRGGEFQTRFSHQTGRRFISAATTTATAAPRRWRRAHRHHSAAKWVFGDWAQGRERRSFPKLPRQYSPLSGPAKVVSSSSSPCARSSALRLPPKERRYCGHCVAGGQRGTAGLELITLPSTIN